MTVKTVAANLDYGDPVSLVGAEQSHFPTSQEAWLGVACLLEMLSHTNRS